MEHSKVKWMESFVAANTTPTTTAPNPLQVSRLFSVNALATSWYTKTHAVLIWHKTRMPSRLTIVREVRKLHPFPQNSSAQPPPTVGHDTVESPNSFVWRFDCLTTSSIFTSSQSVNMSTMTIRWSLGQLETFQATRTTWPQRGFIRRKMLVTIQRVIEDWWLAIIRNERESNYNHLASIDWHTPIIRRPPLHILSIEETHKESPHFDLQASVNKLVPLKRIPQPRDPRLPELMQSLHRLQAWIHVTIYLITVV